MFIYLVAWSLSDVVTCKMTWCMQDEGKWWMHVQTCPITWREMMNMYMSYQKMCMQMMCWWSNNENVIDNIFSSIFLGSGWLNEKSGLLPYLDSNMESLIMSFYRLPPFKNTLENNYITSNTYMWNMFFFPFVITSEWEMHFHGFANGLFFIILR